MGRKNRRDRQEPAPVRVGSNQWTESGPRGEWTVRLLRGNEKSYVCPGCNQSIPAWTGHIVAWREDSLVAADGRRHWHKPCWDRSAHRR